MIRRPKTAPAEDSIAPPDDTRDPVRESVQTVVDLHRRFEGSVNTHQRNIERLTAAIGRPIVLYITLGVVGLWVTINTALHLMGRPTLDTPPFFWLQGVVGLAALLVTTMVLITQNRQDKHAERRAQLDLQVSILVEQKVTKLIVLVEELRRDLPNVSNRRDAEIEKLSEPADVQAVVAALDWVLDQEDAALGNSNGS